MRLIVRVMNVLVKSYLFHTQMSDTSEAFDWDAYHRDTRELSLASKGAWWDCLYKMRLSVTRGHVSAGQSLPFWMPERYGCTEFNPR